MNSAKPITEEEKFIEVFREIQGLAHSVNVQNGWWKKRNIIETILAGHQIDNRPSLVIELLGLADSENAEGMEAARKHDPSTWCDTKTPHTLARECAGSVVRLMDLCEKLGINLGEAVIEEIKHNQGRGFMHGGNAA
jgi:hypothetical protein